MDTIINEPLAQWVQRSRIGDREAFAKIVRQYQQIVSGITFGILGDFHKSEDIAQETFLIAWKKLDQLEDAAKLPGWLCQIARNLAKQHLLKTTGKMTVSISETGQPLTFPANTEEPIEQAIREERSRLIWDAVGKIPEKYRVPLILYYRSEKSSSAIAAALEISEDALSMRLSRAKKYLRKELEKQVEGAISSSGPGEFFSLAVIASLPAVLSAASTGEAVAATTTGAGTTFAASAMVAAPKSGPSGTALFGASGYGILASFLLGIISTSFCCLFFILGAVPGIWFSARNAPTLRTRRYLILTSLRANVIIAFACFLVWAFFQSVGLVFEIVEHCGIPLAHEVKEAYFAPIVYITFLILGIAVALFAVVSPWCYRKILREDLGLAAPKKAVPLEESPLSFARLEKTHKRFSTACLVMLIWYIVTLVIGNILMVLGVIQEQFEWSVSFFLEVQGISYGFVFVGIVFCFVFRKLHRQLLDTAKDEATFQNIGPAWDRSKTPFGKKVFVEWLVYFGCFIAAGVILALKPSFDYDWIPYYPILLSLKLGLILAVSIVFAAINAGFPRMRWLVIPGACFLALLGIAVIRRFLDYGRNVSFLDSPGDWPYLFGIIFLNIFVAISIFATLILGGLHYFAQWNGKTVRFSLPKKIAIALCISGTLLLFAAPWCYSSLRIPYWYGRIVYKEGNDDKRLEICNEMMQSSEKNGRSYIDFLDYRASIYTEMREYENALADLDTMVQLHDDGKLGDWERRNRFSTVLSDRGNVKFVIGDLHGAIADYTEALNPLTELSNRSGSTWYNRGFAYEKLGETEKAIADYNEVIARAKKNQYPYMYDVHSLVPRPGYDDEKHQKSYLKNGYIISIDELKDIRDRLQKSKSEVRSDP